MTRMLIFTGGKNLKWLSTVLLLTVSVLAHAEAYTPESVPNLKLENQSIYVTDPDALLQTDEVDWLNRYAGELEEKTKVEVCIVALGSIGEADAFEFSYELFQRWGIGKKGQNTGVLILFVYESHDIQIRTGTGIEGVLTDAVCSKIIHEDMIPAFKMGAYGVGLCAGLAEIYAICTDGDAPEELLNMRSATNRGRYAAASESDSDDSEGWSSVIIVGSVVLGIIGLGFLSTWFENHRKCPKCKKRKGRRMKTITEVQANYNHGGKGYYEYKCDVCGHEWTVNWESSKLTHSSSSGRSSGSWGGSSSSGRSGGSWGGGSTSGGGAGGKW